MACDKLRELLGGSAECYSVAGSASENGKRISFRKPANVSICRVKVDGCLITDNNQRKCDYLFGVDNKQYFLVELKGQDLGTAVDQITNTFRIVDTKIKSGAGSYTGIVVSSSVPRLADQSFRKLQQDAMRKLGLKIDRKQIQHEVVL